MENNYDGLPPHRKEGDGRDSGYEERNMGVCYEVEDLSRCRDCRNEVVDAVCIACGKQYLIPAPLVGHLNLGGNASHPIDNEEGVGDRPVLHTGLISSDREGGEYTDAYPYGDYGQSRNEEGGQEVGYRDAHPDVDDHGYTDADTYEDYDQSWYDVGGEEGGYHDSLPDFEDYGDYPPDNGHSSRCWCM